MSRQDEVDKIAFVLFEKIDFVGWTSERRSKVAQQLVDNGIRSKDGFKIDNGGFPTEGYINPIDYKEEI